MKQRLFSLTFFQWTGLLFVAALYWGLRYECLHADAANAICLSSATPALTFVREVLGGAYFPWSLENHYLYTFYGSLTLLAFALIALLTKRSCPWWSALYLMALGLCAYGEFMSVRENSFAFAALYSAGLVLAFSAFYLITRKGEPHLSDAWLDPEARRTIPRWFEIGAFVVMIIAIATARFYAVNRIPGHWDPEMCGHRPVVASWNLMVEQELGRFSQQSSGLSWVLAHRFFTRFDDPFYFFIDQRILGAAISLVNCWLVYFLMRSLAGPFAALMGLIVFAFGPLEIDWARGPTLHNLPIFIGLLMLWWSQKAFTERTWRAFFGVALLIIASKYFYPSARLIALGPSLALMGVLIWHRKEWKGDKRKLLLIPLGGLGYVYSRSLLVWYTTGTFQWVFPFEKIQPVNGEEGLISALTSMAKGIPVLTREIFSIPHIVDHYTRHATVYPLHVLPSLGVVFAGVALVRLLWTVRDPLALVWIGVLVGGAIPGLMTGLADRRFAFTIIALTLLAVLELSWFMNRLLAPRLPRVTPILKTGMVSLSAICLCFLQTSVMFARSPIRPHQLNFTDAVRPLVTPGTLVIHMDGDNPCPFFYGIYDLLQQSEGRIGYIYAMDLPGGVNEAIRNPHITTATWQYRHTLLSTQADVAKSRKDWSRLMYVFYTHPSTIAWQRMLQERYPKGSGREIPVPPSNAETNSVYVFETPWEP